MRVAAGYRRAIAALLAVSAAAGCGTSVMIPVNAASGDGVMRQARPNPKGRVQRAAPPTLAMFQAQKAREGGASRRPFAIDCRRRLYNRHVVKTFGDGSIHRMLRPFA